MYYDNIMIKAIVIKKIIIISPIKTNGLILFCKVVVNISAEDIEDLCISEKASWSQAMRICFAIGNI